MLAFISTVVYDAFGYAAIPLLPSHRPGRIERRMTRTRTLDGGCAMTDFGHSESDRDIGLTWRSDEELDERVRRMVRFHGQLHLSWAEGFYLVAPAGFERRDDESSLSLMVIEKLSISED